MTLATIGDCYHMFLTSNASAELDTNHLDSPRQRDEFHFPQISAGIEFSYTWKQYLYSSTGTSTTWFHIMQVFGVVEDNPLVTLDAGRPAHQGLRARHRWYIVRHHRLPHDGFNELCWDDDDAHHLVSCTKSISTSTLFANSWVCRGMFGPSGSLSYEVKNTVTGDEIISYTVDGAMGAGDG